MNEQAIWLVIGGAFFLGNAMLLAVAVIDWRENRTCIGGNPYRCEDDPEWMVRFYDSEQDPETVETRTHAR